MLGGNDVSQLEFAAEVLFLEREATEAQYLLRFYECSSPPALYCAI